MTQHSVHIAFAEASVSVRHRVCCGTLFRGRFIRLIRLSVAVNHGSTFELRTTLGAERGAKAAAEAGNNMVGIMVDVDESTEWGGGGGGGEGEEGGERETR